MKGRDKMERTMKVKIREEHIERLVRPVSNKELMNSEFTNIHDFRGNERKKITKEIAVENGYDPINYGMWGASIVKQQDGYYAVWKRCITCD